MAKHPHPHLQQEQYLFSGLLKRISPEKSRPVDLFCSLSKPVNPEIRRKIRRRNRAHARNKKMEGANLLYLQATPATGFMREKSPKSDSDPDR